MEAVSHGRGSPISATSNEVLESISIIYIMCTVLCGAGTPLTGY